MSSSVPTKALSRIPCEFAPAAGSQLTRRSLLMAAAAMPMALAGFGVGAQEMGYSQDFWNQPRTIWMKRPATGEEIRATYWADGDLVQREYIRLCTFMRDASMERRIRLMQGRGQKVPAGLYASAAISVVLLDILYATGGWLAFHNMARPIILTSGFRHLVTNSETEGAAWDSRHVKGGAGDIIIPGVSPQNVSAYGRWLSGGGVGWYERKGFTHVDDGRLRSWKG